MGKIHLAFMLPENAFERAVGRRRVFSARFPMILDDYVLRDFCFLTGAGHISHAVAGLYSFRIARRHPAHPFLRWWWASICSM